MAAKPLRLIYQIKVTLTGIRPPIWRRLLVRSDITLEQFHEILQDAMGWMNCHLHQFEHADEVYGMEVQNELALDFDDEVADEGKHRLSELLRWEKDALIYEYDFGDSWRHKVVLERMFPFDPRAPLAQCAKGKRACPPEDCGGSWGYLEMLRILGDPEDAEYEETWEWVGEDFDPERFDLNEINQLLKRY